MQYKATVALVYVMEHSGLKAKPTPLPTLTVAFSPRFIERKPPGPLSHLFNKAFLGSGKAKPRHSQEEPGQSQYDPPPRSLSSEPLIVDSTPSSVGAVFDDAVTPLTSNDIRSHISKTVPAQAPYSKAVASAREKERVYGVSEGASIATMIGHLTMMASEHWPWKIVSEVVKRLSESEDDIKDALRALRRDFESGEPRVQLAAVQLWAILLRNVENRLLMHHSARTKFTETLEGLLASTRISPAIRIGPSDEDIQHLFRECKIGRANASRLARALATWSPRLQEKTIERVYLRCRSSQELVVAEIPQALEEAVRSRVARDEEALADGESMGQRLEQTVPEKLLASLLSVNAELFEAIGKYDSLNTNPDQTGVAECESNLDYMSVTPASIDTHSHQDVSNDPRYDPTDEDIRHIFQQCKIGCMNASLLSQALVLSRAEDLVREDDYIMEFYLACCSSLKFIVAQIPWMTSLAQRPRLSRDAEAKMISQPEEQPLRKTTTERLLTSLLTANAELAWAIEMCDALDEYSEVKRKKTGLGLTSPGPAHSYDYVPSAYTSSGVSETENSGMENSADEQDMTSHNGITRPLDLTPSSSNLPRISLYNFPRFDSSTGEPADWLEASHEHLVDYIVQSKRERAAQRECTGWHLAIYLYGATDDFGALRTAVATCQDCNILTALCRFKVTSDGLRHSFKKDSARINGTDHDMDVLRNILALDVDVICVRLFKLVKDGEQYRHLLQLQGDEAQSLLDLVQTLLDLPSLDRVFRGPFLNAMLRLSRRSKLFPGRLWQQQVSLEGTEPITAGKFGDVWKGLLCGQAVAVKVLKIYQKSDLDKHIKKVLQETVIWRQLRHVNVLPFLCLHHVDNSERRIGLVSPWMENGNVKEFLQHVLDVDRISLVTDIAEGLEYLHTMEPKIIHGDLKAVPDTLPCLQVAFLTFELQVNILISDSHRACLADFGLSSVSESQAIRLTSFSSAVTGGTMRWKAPELLDGSESASNTQTDVYAFACVCYEIFSCDIPFSELDEYPVMWAVIKGRRPPRPRQCKKWQTSCQELGLDDGLWALVERCWGADASSRPSMNVVLQELPPRHQATLGGGGGGIDHQQFDISSGGQWEDLMSWLECQP
ncbi:hypothetical protein DXG01_002699 [Tephrocybe rancida]|nr:hypothetical protein DXG01_002699 [Tephrocybe rancida]